MLFFTWVPSFVACKAGGFAGGMIRKQRLRTTGRHFERANKGETGERKKRREGGGGGEKGEKRGGSASPPQATRGCAARCRGFAAFACAHETQQYHQLRRLKFWKNYIQVLKKNTYIYI